MKLLPVGLAVAGLVAVSLLLPRIWPEPGPSRDSTQAAEQARTDTVWLARTDPARARDSATIAALRRRLATVGRPTVPEPTAPPDTVPEASTGAWWQDQALTARAERDSLRVVADSALTGWAGSLEREREGAALLRASALQLQRDAVVIGGLGRDLARAGRPGLGATCGVGFKGLDCTAGITVRVRLPFGM